MAASPTPDSPDPERVAVVGPGRVGRSLAAALSEAGRPVTVRGRASQPPPSLASLPGVAYRQGAPSASAGPPAPTVVFCVPDDVLSEVAGAWAGSAALPAGETASPEAVALHTSGVHAADALSAMRDSGWEVAAWHPLTALAEPRADAFRGVPFGVEGDGAAVERARELTRTVGGRPLRLEAGAHPRYHASAVFASNFLVACLSVATRELSAATGGAGSLEDLLPLARAAVDNLAGEGLAAGATGPLTRGDAGTVRRHLEALPEASAELYRGLARELLAVVEGRLAPREVEELRRVLRSSRAEGGRPPD